MASGYSNKTLKKPISKGIAEQPRDSSKLAPCSRLIKSITHKCMCGGGFTGSPSSLHHDNAASPSAFLRRCILHVAMVTLKPAQKAAEGRASVRRTIRFIHAGFYFYLFTEPV